MKADCTKEVAIPTGVEFSFDGDTYTVKGSNATLTRTMRVPRLKVDVKDGVIIFTVQKSTQREKKLLFTLAAHLENMFRGCQEDHKYKLKICSGHFPMNVSLKDTTLTVKNFLGESVPRTLKLKENVVVKVDGDMITVTSSEKEIAGQQAADIEQLTRITNRDRRIFQDGIYIVEKDGVSII